MQHPSLSFLPLFATAALVLGSGLAVHAAPKVQNVVASDAAPTYLIAKGKGLAKLLLNASTGAKDVAVSILTFEAGATVPEHTHDSSSETLYVESGSVDMVIGGRPVHANAGDAIYIPAGVLHSAHVLGPVLGLRAVQIYVAAGPEQRFAKGKLLPAPK